MNLTERHLRMIGILLQEIYRIQDTSTLHAWIFRNLTKVVDGHNVFLGIHDMRQTLITGCIPKNSDLKKFAGLAVGLAEA